MQPSMMRVALACLWLGACAGDDGDGGSPLPGDLDVIASTPASGTISGMPFTVGTRYMNVSGSDLYVDLLPVAAADCTLDETDGRYPFIIFFVPPTPGRYPLDFGSRTVTFVDAPSNNLIVSAGVIEIEAITATTVTGGLHVFDSEFGEVNGRFDGTLCFSNP
jgi:hypothetical protein